MTKERLTYVDTAKFIAIFCVLASHSYMSAPVSHLFFYFQVPLFFILHGYVHKERNNLTIPYYLMNSGKKLVYRVLVPYFLLAFILGSSLSGRNFLYVLYGSMHSMVNITSTHLWYLPCFFLTVLLFNLLMILTTKRKCLRPLLILIIGISGALVDVNSDLKVLWGG